MVIDIVDNHTLFQNQYKKRCTYYKSKNYLIEQYDNPHNYYGDIETERETRSKKGSQKNKEPQEKIKCLINL